MVQEIGYKLMWTFFSRILILDCTIRRGTNGVHIVHTPDGRVSGEAYVGLYPNSLTLVCVDQ